LYYFSLRRSGLGNNFNQANIIRLYKRFYEDLIVAKKLSFVVEMFVLIDIEWDINEFCLVRVPNLSRVVQVWHLDSNEILITGDLIVLNSNYEVFALVVANWAVADCIII